MLKQLPTITCWQEFLLQFEMHLEILSNKYVSRQIADGVVFQNVEMSCQGWMPARRTNELDVCRTVFVWDIFS